MFWTKPAMAESLVSAKNPISVGHDKNVFQESYWLIRTTSAASGIAWILKQLVWMHVMAQTRLIWLTHPWEWDRHGIKAEGGKVSSSDIGVSFLKTLYCKMHSITYKERNLNHLQITYMGHGKNFFLKKTKNKNNLDRHTGLYNSLNCTFYPSRRRGNCDEIK